MLCLLGDGEMHEGSNWEALMLIRHHRLNNLVTLIDNNRISMITFTDRVLNMNPLSDCYEGFGFRTLTVDGHDVNAVFSAIQEIRSGEQPGVIICNTVKGKGVACAEDQPIWHYQKPQ